LAGKSHNGILEKYPEKDPSAIAIGDPLPHIPIDHQPHKQYKRTRPASYINVHIIVMRPAFHFTLLHYVLLGVKNSSAFVRVATRFPFKCSLSYTEDNHSIDSQIEEEEEDEEGFLFGNSKKTTNKQNWKRNHGTTDELLEAVNVYKGGNGSLTSKSSSGISAFASPTTRKDGQIFLNSQLKRNLVQETVRAYKDDLFRELSTGVSSASNYSKFDDSVCDKLTSLIQVNPVSTTTDSNLLEGKWEFAYMAPNASKVVNGKPSRLEVRKEKGENSENIQVGCRSRWTSALSGFLSTSSRIIVLENLIESEDPYLVDVVRIVGGLFKVQSRSIVDGLTRTSLKLSSDGSKQFGVGPFVFSSKQKHQNNHKSLTFENLYLDSDLCISMTELGEL